MRTENITSNRRASSNISLTAGTPQHESDLHRVAAQFESLLLAQMTSALNASADEDSDLFRSEATDLYRQMFSEQLARTMAESGGIGLREIIVQQLKRRMNSLATNDLPGSPLNLSGNSPLSGNGPAEINQQSMERAISVAKQLRNAQAIDPQISPSFNDRAGESELQIPIEGRLSSRFGTRRDPINGSHRFHRGLDIAAARGTPVAAAAEGQVVFAGYQHGYGNTVLIEHADGRQTRYAHADELKVVAGERVAAGQVVATVGSTGRSTGAHLHFEVLENGRQVDPLKAIVEK
jgi:murein DD-endopeptidase MepM/ murein hydrolase activator NlpD